VHRLKKFDIFFYNLQNFNKNLKEVSRNAEPEIDGQTNALKFSDKIKILSTLI